MKVAKTLCTVAVMVLAVTVAVGLVIERNASAQTGVETPGTPGSGCLDAVDGDGEPLGGCPLEHTYVKADISGFIGRVTVEQTFGNPFEEPIEAIYTFPLSDRGAVDRMTMRVGDRVIKGVIKKREEAHEIYEQARDVGKTASLLDQERPNIFTQRVANIMPGENIKITISYIEYLEYEDGEYEFAFPMVVGPRYIPGTPTGGGNTTQVPDAGRITPPVTPEGTRAGHDISLEVDLDAGVPIQAIRSKLHAVDIERPGESKAHVGLKNKSEIPNRDFVLKYAVAGEDIGDAIMTHAGGRGGFFTLILQPPERVEPDEVTPKEMMFVIDCSGSMRGFPIEKAKKTMRLCIEQMNPNDTFNLVSFAGGVGYCFDKPAPNTEENRRTALDYLANLEGGGGTEMMKAIRAALEGQDDPERLRIVCFMTDGFIGNDMAILDAVRKNARTARVFSFGIGNGVNRFLLENMARVGRGAAEIVTLESDSDAAAEKFRERVHSPILTDITVDFGGLPVEEVYPDPGAMPDLFTARPLILKGRYVHGATGTITVRGKTAQGPFERAVDVVLPKEEPGHDVLAPLWARERIAWLMDQDWLDAQKGQPQDDIKAEIIRLGLEFNLVTQYTSFVAVEERVVNEDGKIRTVEVPVEMTDGVSYEGVFGTHDMAETAGVYDGMRSKSKAMRGAGRPQFLGTPRNRHVVGSRVRPAVPRRLVEAESVAKDEDKEQPEVGHPKVDRALWDLGSKLVNGDYTQGGVKVRDGWVEVFIIVEDAGEACIDALRDANVRMLSVAHSSMKVYAKVRVDDLDDVADIDCVKKIEPARF